MSWEKCLLRQSVGCIGRHGKGTMKGKLILYLCNITTLHIFQRNSFLPAETSEYQKGREDPVWVLQVVGSAGS